MSHKAFQAEFPIEVTPQSDSAPVTSLSNDWGCTDTQVTLLETDSFTCIHCQQHDYSLSPCCARSPTLPGEEHKLCRSSLCTFLQSTLTSFALGIKYLPQLPVLEHPKPMPSQVSHPYNTAGTFTLMFVLIFIVR
jgi:hypothetical protein